MAKMIDLGRECKTYGCEPCVPEKPKTYIEYPTLYLRGVNLGVGTGEFTFTAKGKVVSVSEKSIDGKETEYCCEIEVHAISPDGGEAKKEGGLAGALKDIAKKKQRESDEDYDE